MPAARHIRMVRACWVDYLVFVTRPAFLTWMWPWCSDWSFSSYSMNVHMITWRVSCLRWSSSIVVRSLVVLCIGFGLYVVLRLANLKNRMEDGDIKVHFALFAYNIITFRVDHTFCTCAVFYIVNLEEGFLLISLLWWDYFSGVAKYDYKLFAFALNFAQKKTFTFRRVFI